MRKPKHIKLDPYEWDGLVFYKWSVPATHRYIEKYVGREQAKGFLENAKASNGLAIFPAKGHWGPWIIWISPYGKPATLAHEAFHVTSRVLRGRDIPLDDSSEEAYAYLMSHIINSVVK